VVDTTTVIDTKNGILTFYGKYNVRDSKKGGYGKISLAEAFERSSNTGMVQAIYENYKNHPERFVNRLINMGLNEPLGIPVLGEGIPKIPHPKDTDWDGLDLPWMAYGYGVSMTPLQILTFYNAIANDGVMVKPRFVDQIRNLGDLSAQKLPVEIVNASICSEETLSKVQALLKGVVEKPWGTARNIFDPEFAISGKTGTCQLDYTKDEVQYVSSFVGYFPSDKPKYSCIVVVHRPNKKKGYYGNRVAAPVFKTIAHKLYSSIPKDQYLDLNRLQMLTSKEESLLIYPSIQITQTRP
jgi:cell division protein FtsI (penicillin-binding protein 3)